MESTAEDLRLGHSTLIEGKDTKPVWNPSENPLTRKQLKEGDGWAAKYSCNKATLMRLSHRDLGCLSEQADLG